MTAKEYAKVKAWCRKQVQDMPPAPLFAFRQIGGPLVEFIVTDEGELALRLSDYPSMIVATAAQAQELRRMLDEAFPEDER